MEDDNKNEDLGLPRPDMGGVKWKSVVAIFGEVSTWVVVPIVLALIAGKALDNHFHTKPWIFLGLTAVAFLFSIYGIVRTVKKYLKSIESSNDKQKE